MPKSKIERRTAIFWDGHDYIVAAWEVKVPLQVQMITRFRSGLPHNAEGPLQDWYDELAVHHFKNEADLSVLVDPDFAPAGAIQKPIKI